MAATPISPRDVALGNLAWIMARLSLVTGIFTLVDHRVRGVPVAAGRAVHPGRCPDRDGLRRSDRRVLGDAAQPEPLHRRSSASSSRRCSCSPGRSSRSASLPASTPGPGLAVTPLYHGVALTRSLALGTVDGGSGRDGRPPRLSRDAGHGGRLPHDPDHRAPVDPRMTALRITPVLRHRQSPLDAPDRAEPVRLQARLDGPPVGLLRAAVLPARDRLRARGADRHDPGTRRRSRSATSSSSRRRSWPPRR